MNLARNIYSEFTLQLWTLATVLVYIDVLMSQQIRLRDNEAMIQQASYALFLEQFFLCESYAMFLFAIFRLFPYFFHDFLFCFC